MSARHIVPLIDLDFDKLLGRGVDHPVQAEVINGAGSYVAVPHGDQGVEQGSGRSSSGPFVKDRSEIEEAKSRMPMTALLDRLVPTWKKKNPLRDDDRHYSFHAGDGGWIDYGNGDKGDQITFLERLYGVERGEGIRRFLDLAGV